MAQTNEARCGCCGTEVAQDSESTELEMTCYCPVEGVIDTVSKGYAMQVIGLLGSHGPLRYSAIEDALDTSSTSTLSKNLTELAEADLIDRKSYDEVPPHVEYSLTPKGRELQEHLQPLLEWADRE